MKVYAIRKRRGQWNVCSEGNVLLQFESYSEAVDVARSAARVLAERGVNVSIAVPSSLEGEGHSDGCESRPFRN